MHIHIHTRSAFCWPLNSIGLPRATVKTPSKGLHRAALYKELTGAHIWGHHKKNLAKSWFWLRFACTLISEPQGLPKLQSPSLAIHPQGTPDAQLFWLSALLTIAT